MDPLYKFYIDSVKGENKVEIDRTALEAAHNRFVNNHRDAWVTRDIFNPEVIGLATSGLPKFRFEYKFKRASVRYVQDKDLKEVYMAPFSPHEAYLIHGRPVTVYKIMNLLNRGNLWEENAAGKKYIVIPVYNPAWTDADKEKLAYPDPYTDKDICVLSLDAKSYAGVVMEDGKLPLGLKTRNSPTNLIEILYMYEGGAYRTRKDVLEVIRTYSARQVEGLEADRTVGPLSFSFKGKQGNLSTYNEDSIWQNVNGVISGTVQYGEHDSVTVNIPKGVLLILSQDYTQIAVQPHKLYAEAGLMPMVRRFRYTVNGCILCPHMYTDAGMEGWIKLKDGPQGGYIVEANVYAPMQRLTNELYRGESPTPREAYLAQQMATRTILTQHIDFWKLSPVALDDMVFSNMTHQEKLNHYKTVIATEMESPLSLETLVWYHPLLKKMNYDKRKKVHSIWGEFQGPFTDETLETIRGIYKSIDETKLAVEDNPSGQYDEFMDYLNQAYDEFNVKPTQEAKEAFLQKLSEAFNHLTVKGMEVGKNTDGRIVLPYGRLNTARYNGKSKYFTYDL